LQGCLLEKVDIVVFVAFSIPGSMPEAKNPFPALWLQSTFSIKTLSLHLHSSGSVHKLTVSKKVCHSGPVSSTGKLQPESSVSKDTGCPRIKYGAGSSSPA